MTQTKPQYTSNSKPINFPKHFNNHQSPTLQSHPLNLKPITQKIITKNKQKINININLKILNPPPKNKSKTPPIIHTKIHPKNHNKQPTKIQYQIKKTYPTPKQNPQPQQNYTQIKPILSNP